MSRVVSHRSVGSHFLDYIDFIEKKQGLLWGRSIFSDVFFDGLIRAIRNQDFKGPVIFLGNHPSALPTIDVLARFGFEDFVFLDLSEKVMDKKKKIYEDLMKFLGIHISAVDARAFIRSQKEFSLCFVMEDEYDSQILEDMSYFHFLSNHSIVFDLSGRSNFLFKEVKALGVDLVENKTLEDISFNMHVKLIKEYKLS